MHAVLRVLLVEPNADERERFKNLVSDLDSIWIEADCARYHEAADLLGELHPDVVVVGMDEDPELALDLVQELRHQLPELQIVVLSRDGDSQSILQAMRAGANEYLTRPLRLDELLGAVNRARQMVARERGEKGRASQVIVVAGVSGGVGCTTIATNLGVLLAQDPRNRVVLVDLDLVLGDADILLDLVHDYTLYDLVQNISRLDFSLLKRALVHHRSGLLFLPHPATAAEAGAVAPEDIRRLLGLLRATFTHLVVDVSKRLDRLDREAIRSADRVIVVAQLNIACIRNLSRMLETLEAEEQDEPIVVFNRVGSREAAIPLEKVESTLSRKADCVVPNDWFTFAAAHNAGEPAVLHAPAAASTQALRDLVRLIEPSYISATETKPRKNWIARILSR
jgi:pilus assembly protein CpaE